MRLRHWVILGFIIIGILYVAHLYVNHGGAQAFTSGLGLGGGNAGRMGA